MLFFFRGHHGQAVRAFIGAVLLAIGLTVQHGAILVVFGAILFLWGLTATVSSQRSRRAHIGSGSGAA